MSEDGNIVAIGARKNGNLHKGHVLVHRFNSSREEWETIYDEDGNDGSDEIRGECSGDKSGDSVSFLTMETLLPLVQRRMMVVMVVIVVMVVMMKVWVGIVIVMPTSADLVIFLHAHGLVSLVILPCLPRR